MEGESSNPVEPSTAAELRGLVDKAQNGDPSALPRINQILDETPAIWRHLGDVGNLAEQSWIGLLAEKNPAVAGSIARTLTDMRSELGGENPTAIEKVLVNQIVICWLQMKTLEFGAANVEKNGGGKTNRAHVRLDLASKRHLAALKALTDLRRLAPQASVPPGRPRIFQNDQRRA
jgi:hypothetical protein